MAGMRPVWLSVSLVHVGDMVAACGGVVGCLCSSRPGSTKGSERHGLSDHQQPKGPVGDDDHGQGGMME
jgi:hypothetical protein